MSDIDKAQLAALGAATVRDPLTDPVRGDVISYRVPDTDSAFVVVVTEVSVLEVAYRGVELLGDDGDEAGNGRERLVRWGDWSDFRDVTVLRRGDA